MSRLTLFLLAIIVLAATPKSIKMGSSYGYTWCRTTYRLSQGIADLSGSYDSIDIESDVTRLRGAEAYNDDTDFASCSRTADACTFPMSLCDLLDGNAIGH